MKCVSDNINNPIKQEEFIMKNLKKTTGGNCGINNGNGIYVWMRIIGG